MKIWRTCKETGKEFTTARAFLNNLRTLNMTSKEYYDKYHKNNTEGSCLLCLNPTSYDSFGYRKYCSNVCGCKSLGHRFAVSQRFIKNPDALESFRKSRVGVNVNVKKRKETIKKKCELLGISVDKYYSDHAKNSYASTSELEKEQRVLRRMSTIENNHNRDGRSFYKSYIFFDEYVSLQGYEPIVLDYLINDRCLQKEDIKVGKFRIPIIRYVIDGKKRMYFPDFYLPKNNLIIEVKSKYTFQHNKRTVLTKCAACVESGYSILLLIVSRHEVRKHKLEESKKLLDWAISSQAPNPTWYGEGSTTILYGVESSDSKCGLS